MWLVPPYLPIRCHLILRFVVSHESFVVSLMLLSLGKESAKWSVALILNTFETRGLCFLPLAKTLSLALAFWQLLGCSCFWDVSMSNFSGSLFQSSFNAPLCTVSRAACSMHLLNSLTYNFDVFIWSSRDATLIHFPVCHLVPPREWQIQFPQLGRMTDGRCLQVVEWNTRSLSLSAGRDCT